MELLITLSLLFIAMTLFALFWYAFDYMFGGEDYPTSKNTVKKIAEVIAAHHFEKGLLYDLGSSRGGFVLDILNEAPGLRAVGIDNSLLRTWIAKLRNRMSKKKAVFVKEDIFDADISQADVVYVYLPRPMLPAVEEKLQKELKSGSIVLTSRVCFPDWQPSSVIQKNPANSDEEDTFVYGL